MKRLRIVLAFVGLALSNQGLADRRIEGHLPLREMAQGRYLQREQAEKKITLTVVLNLRNQAELSSLIQRMYSPGDPLYGHFLSSKQFKRKFSPTKQDLNQVARYLMDRQLRVVSRTANTIKVEGQILDVERAFNVQMGRYQAKDSRLVYSANLDPEVAEDVAPKIAGVLGLNSFSKFITHRHLKSNGTGSPIGTGPNGGLSPADVSKAYNFSSLNSSGTGQVLGLMELDGYNPSDISTYANQFGLNSVPSLQNVSVDGFDGTPGEGADEVTLDIELMMAVAPGASQILVYEGPNSETGPIDVYAQIANDNLAKQISSSWGSPEAQNTSAFLNSENTIFMQMAAQGQSIFAASGDSGAYDDGKTLGVDDPASQPYVTATGGTTLALNSDGTYAGESSWGIPAQGKIPAQGGGGGVSSVWPLPSYQSALANLTGLGASSLSNRLVPDISIDANPQTGYAVYTGGKWQVFGGTSCAAPIWAAYTSLVNSVRVSQGLPVLGFMNPTLYALAQAQGPQLFNDVSDGSTNLFYPAVPGYDLSTGWGSMNAPSLLAALAAFATGN